MVVAVRPIVTVRRRYRDRLDDPPRTDSVNFTSRFDAIDYATQLYRAGVVERVECIDHTGRPFFTARRNQFDFALAR